MPFESECTIREASRSDVKWFFRKASARDWDGVEPPFIDCGRLQDCDGFLVAEYGGEVIGAIVTSSKGMDGSSLPTIANVYVLSDFARKGVGSRLLVAAMKSLLRGVPKAFCRAVTPAMVNTIKRLPTQFKERLEHKVDLCGADAWDAWERIKGTD
jgi:hypothetical protein